MSDCLQLQGLGSARLLCPWDSPGKNTGVGCHSLFQGIFLTQESNAGLLNCRQILYCLSYQGSPFMRMDTIKKKQKTKTENRKYWPRWRKIGTCILLEMYVVAMESSMGLIQKQKFHLIVWFHFWVYIKKNWKLGPKEIFVCLCT